MFMGLVMPVTIGCMVLAVDAGRMMVAGSELQDVADAAARYAAAGMLSSSTPQTTAYRQAALVCGDATVDGQKIGVAPAQVETGYWDTSNRSFIAGNDASVVNAVRITLNVTLGGDGSAPLFAGIVGSPPRTVSVVSIASASVVSRTVRAPASGNLWLSGANDDTAITNNQADVDKFDDSGTSANAKQRPDAVNLANLGLRPGDLVSFEGLSGLGNNGAGAGDTDADGNQGDMVSLGVNYSGGVPSSGANGIANTRAPLAACMALFLGDAPPSDGPEPAGLDFGTADARDYTLLEPGVKQPFFVGDGKTSLGQVQRIRVPDGATRIFMGMMDAWQWNDNSGNFNLKFYRGTTVSTVK